jgi:hypothetical protein
LFSGESPRVIKEPRRADLRPSGKLAKGHKPVQCHAYP